MLTTQGECWLGELGGLGGRERGGGGDAMLSQLTEPDLLQIYYRGHRNWQSLICYVYITEDTLQGCEGEGRGGGGAAMPS